MLRRARPHGFSTEHFTGSAVLALALLSLEQTGTVVSLLVWWPRGHRRAPRERIDVLTVVYAVVNLTLVRMLPVALALLGADLNRPQGIG